MKRLFPALCVLGLTACTTAYPGSPQACAGINDAHVQWDEKTGTVAADLCAGKENDNVRLSGKTPGGLEFSYAAEGAKAFEGQLTSAQMNRELADLRNDIVQELSSALAAAVNVRPAPVP